MVVFIIFLFAYYNQKNLAKSNPIEHVSNSQHILISDQPKDGTKKSINNRPDLT
jgi:hypothetical protein